MHSLIYCKRGRAPRGMLPVTALGGEASWILTREGRKPNQAELGENSKLQIWQSIKATGNKKETNQPGLQLLVIVSLYAVVWTVKTNNQKETGARQH